jgi:hypothetical protein
MVTWREIQKLISLIPEEDLDTPAVFSLDGSDENTWNINSIWDVCPGDTCVDENPGVKYYVSSMD